jgi:hypothetical protein
MHATHDENNACAGAGFCCLWLVLLAVDIRCHLSKESQLSELQRMCLKVVLANAIAMAAIAAANCVAITQGESLLVTVKAVGISLLLSYIVLVLLRSMTMLAVEVATLQAQQKAQGSFIRYICHECRYASRAYIHRVKRSANRGTVPQEPASFLRYVFAGTSCVLPGRHTHVCLMGTHRAMFTVASA